MKKHILLPAMLVAAMFSTTAVKAQEDVNPLLKYISKDETVKASIGGRMYADFAYYHSDWTPMKSGAAITDARIHAALTYGKFYFYADFGFGKGEFSQKNLFAQYTFKATEYGVHSVKVGYYNEPSSMSAMTSTYNYHFFARPFAVQALAPGRALGATYRFFNKRFFFDQGVFAQFKYNEQEEGNQGVSVSGRWLYKPINEMHSTLQVGISARYQHFSGGTEYAEGVLQTSVNYSSNMQSYVDEDVTFLDLDLPWARNALSITPEVLYRSDRFFTRAEYIWTRVWKDRDDQRLFEQNLGGQQSWQTLPSWQGGNKLRPTLLNGGYIELGYLICGRAYTYDQEYGLLKGMGDKNGLEVVARYSYLDLSDITKGDRFIYGNNKFYPDSDGDGVAEIVDYPRWSSVDGGKAHAVTVGLNYSFNQYIKVMGEYQYTNLENVYFPDDKNFHQLQLRVAFAF